MENDSQTRPAIGGGGGAQTLGRRTLARGLCGAKERNRSERWPGFAAGIRVGAACRGAMGGILAGWLLWGLTGCFSSDSNRPLPAEQRSPARANSTTADDGETGSDRAVGQEPQSPAADLGATASSTGATKDQTEAARQVVLLRVVQPGRDPVVGEVVWRAGMTVFDALAGFSPPLNVESTGQGESLFVKSIAGQANLGSAGDNWIYRVNGKLGDRSCGVFAISPNDEILWSFGKYE